MSSQNFKMVHNGMLALTVLAFCFLGCKHEHAPKSDIVSKDPNKSSKYISINGKTMGTTYQVTYSDKSGIVRHDQIEQLLVDVNQGVSTYIPDSDISKYNRAEKEIILNQQSDRDIPMSSNGYLNEDYVFGHMVDNLLASQEIYKLSNQLFDPTIMPLVNYWGFGYKGREPHEFLKSDTINQILAYVGLEKVSISTDQDNVIIRKSNPSTELDFSAIAKGYGVDLVMQYLKECNVKDAYVEIGGEVSTIGLSPSGHEWKIGINTPDKNAPLNDFEQIVKFTDLALASSGNYRNFHVVNGKSYGHEINPKTGYPEQTDVLSASVLASTCQLADGLATACMVMGSQAALELINSLDGVEVLLITIGQDGSYTHLMSNGFEQYVVE